MNFELKRFVPEEASREVFEARTEFGNTIEKETHPDDPPRSVDFQIRNALGWAELKESQIYVWLVWDGDIVIGELFAFLSQRDNTYLIDGELAVLPSHRRQGVATLLLKKFVEIAEAENRSLMHFSSFDKIPAGSVLLEKLGATRGSEWTVRQLELAALDRNLLENWVASAKEKATDFELHFLEGAYPETQLSEFAELTDVMNTAPKDDLDIEDFVVTPESLREWEAYAKAQGLVRWTYYVRHVPSGELAGYTEMNYDPENPTVMDQQGTGVLPKYRGHSLGKWLKAAMLLKLLQERPSIKFVRTGNADSNAPMLAINRKLGFEPYFSQTVWQLKTSKLKTYLESR